MYTQDPPFAVQIELVEGCTLSCEFCGINGIREKPGNFKFMDLKTVDEIAYKLAHEPGWNPRIEFAMHGEPSMHPEVTTAIEIVRKRMGKGTSMVMFSNGSGFVKDPALIDRLFDAGLNTLGLDAYEHVNIVPRLIQKYTLMHLEPGETEKPYTGVPIYAYPQEKEHNLHSGRRVGHRDIVVIQDISKADTGNHSSLNTHCGGGMQPGPVLAARCAKPFRELAFRWDGSVALCCNDFRGIYKVRNIYHADLHEIWNSPRFMAARRRLMQRDRNFGPCQFCNAKSMRVGLLPDKLGKRGAELGEPTAEDAELIERACAGESYTPAVRRGWEVTPAGLPPGTYPVNILDAKKVTRG